MARIEVGTPLWWLRRLSAALDRRLKLIAEATAYYDRGYVSLPETPQAVSPSVRDAAEKAFTTLAEKGVTNWVSLVADAPVERLEVTGFRFGEEPEGDQDVWSLWQANQLDADSDLVHGRAAQVGNSAVLVWPDTSPAGVAITAEDPTEVIVAYVPGSRRVRAAALKRWVDDWTGDRLANIYLPDGIYKYRSSARAWSMPSQVDGTAPIAVMAPYAQWRPREVEGESWPLKNPTPLQGLVPIIEFRANPSLRPSPFGGGSPEFAKVVSIQDRINQTIFDRLVTSQHYSFPQRHIEGWEPGTDEETGESDALKMHQSRAWTFGDPEVKVGQLPQADFSPFIASVENDIQSMAAITKTPPHYLLGKMINISGDALKAAEAGLIAKTGRHARNFGESWEEVLRVALLAKGDSRAADTSTMVMWGDMESRTWGETVDAVLKMQALGVPQEELWARLPDVKPQDIARWKVIRTREQLFAQIAQPEPAGPAPLASPTSSNGSEVTVGA